MGCSDPAWRPATSVRTTQFTSAARPSQKST
jgi:hypothetical protein